ncbi:MAG: hypothetical protein PHT12_04730 [Patescibacteria group bacterium]|nr:hypothetical protein [Patescibacteria group bacterium]
MFLTVHAAIGSAAVLAVWPSAPTPVAFVIGWGLHYVGDFVPHGDEKLGEWAKRGSVVKRMALASGIDGLVLLFVMAVMIARLKWNWIAVASAAGSCVPDVLWGLEEIFGRKLFGSHRYWHHRIHFASGIRLPLWLGFSFQFSLAVVLWVYCAQHLG